ncbi:hypothetical protein [Aquimarina sp. AU474]|uniref:hypothetical protein n=1 Tax=Aquimarina sp. AU474 TaxID=2108529 RepID=UPI00135B4C74|nr:hypothetical protein [Aquimarina sp. AU474]
MKSFCLNILLLCSGIVNAQFLEKEYEFFSHISQELYEEKDPIVYASIHNYSYYSEILTVDQNDLPTGVFFEYDTNISGSFYKTFENDYFKLSSHFRIDYLQYFEDHIEQSNYKNVWTLGFKSAYMINNKVHLFFNGRIGYNNRGQIEQLTDDRAKLPKAYGLDVGLTWTPNSKLSIATSLWSFNLSKSFIYVDDEGIVNSDSKSERVGVDLETEYKLTDDLIVRSNLTYAYDQNGANNNLELSNEGVLEVILSKNVSGTFGYRYSYQNDMNKSSMVGDIGVNYELSNFRLEIGIQNIFNDTWYEPEFATALRLASDLETEKGNYFVPDDTLFFGASVTYNF